MVYPPVDTEFFTPEPGAGRDYFLLVSRFVPYKRVDLAIEAFNSRDETLLVVGDGPQEKRLKRLAAGNVEFIGGVTDDELRTLYRNCRALVFPGEEDFGLTPVECMACGRPVVAYGRGGTTETVVDGRTGVLFTDHTPSGLDQALDRFARLQLDPADCRDQAKKFDERIFLAKIRAAADYLTGNHAPEKAPAPPAISVKPW